MSVAFLASGSFAAYETNPTGNYSFSITTTQPNELVFLRYYMVAATLQPSVPSLSGNGAVQLATDDKGGSWYLAPVVGTYTATFYHTYNVSDGVDYCTFADSGGASFSLDAQKAGYIQSTSPTVLTSLAATSSNTSPFYLACALQGGSSAVATISAVSSPYSLPSPYVAMLEAAGPFSPTVTDTNADDTPFATLVFKVTPAGALPPPVVVYSQAVNRASRY